jgi:hypothetical protein
MLGFRGLELRSQCASILAFGVLVTLIENHRDGKTRQLWWILPLFALWVNSHGGFAYGVAYLGLYVVGRLWDAWRDGGLLTLPKEMVRLVTIGLLALAVLTLTPWGPTGAIEFLMALQRINMSDLYILEYQPLVVRQPEGFIFFS